MAYRINAFRISNISTSFVLAILLMIGVATHAYSDGRVAASALLVTQIITTQEIGKLGLGKETSNLGLKPVVDARERGNPRAMAFYMADNRTVNSTLYVEADRTLESSDTVSASNLLHNTLNFSIRTVRSSSELHNPRALNQIVARALAVNKFPVTGVNTANRAYRNAYFGDPFMETWQCLTIRF